MKFNLTEPNPGDRVSANLVREIVRAIRSLTPVAGSNVKIAQGPNGTVYYAASSARGTKQSETVHPWKVYALAQSEDVDHCFEIYIPANALTLGKKSPEIEGIESVGDSTDRYKLEDESEIGDGATIFVAVVRTDEEESEGASSEEDEESGVAAKVIVSSALPEEEDGETFLSIFPVAKVSVDDSGDYPVGAVERQYAKSVVALTEPGHEPDDVSIGTVTDEEAEDPDAIQIKDFDNEESDGQHGLAQRLKVVKDGEGEDASYHIEAEENESSVFLLARVNGKIKYIPLTGSDEMDDDETEEDTCKHPGSGESSGSESGSGGVGGGGGGGGGVSGGGDSHEGKACNGTDCD